jgi:hypothetical protein
VKTLSAAVAAALSLGVFAALAVAGDDRGPTLVGRAILASDAYQPGPQSGAFIMGDNGVTPPFPGQPIPGFSAVLDAGHGELWGMPDNGYGAQTNSADFLLRLYRIRPDFETEDGGSGAVQVLRFLQLRDPDGKIPFALTRSDRLLTGLTSTSSQFAAPATAPSGSARSSGRSSCTPMRPGRCSRSRSGCRA